MDRITPEARSRNMSRIRSRDTAPELAVRRYLHGRGLRFRLYLKNLPGKPDLVFPGRRICVFVHGCFWHGCPHCIDGTRKVRSNGSYWNDKVLGNHQRDERHRVALEEAGWQVLTIWACQTLNVQQLKDLAAIIQSPPAT